MRNTAGTVTDSYEYDGFGNQINSTGSTQNSYLYRGEYFDSDLSLYYLSARYYNPATGRFMGRDPRNGNRRNPKSLHKYIYASGNPVNRIDPSGRADIMEWAVLNPGKSTIALVAVGLAVKCVLDHTASMLGYHGPMLCPAVPFGGPGSGGGSGGGSSGSGGSGPGTGPIAGPGNPPPPPLPGPGCQSNPAACAGSGGGGLSNAQKIAQPIIDSSQNYQCVTCANTLASDFAAAGYEGQYVYAQTSADFILSDFGPTNEAISVNGFHQAVVLDIDGAQYVFDNFANGVPLSEWESALQARRPIEYTFGPW